MPNQQRDCARALTAWRKTFNQIKLTKSRQEAVTALMDFALAQHTLLYPKTEVAPASAPAPVSTVDFHGVVEGHNLPKAETFPEETLVLVYGVCPNPRLLAAELPDGRKISVWKGPRSWHLPQRVPCKIDRNTNPKDPIYTPA